MAEQPDGLIHALLLDGRGSARELAWNEALAWEPGDGCLWLHFHFDMASTRDYLERYSGLNDIAIEGLLQEETRPRVVTREQRLLMALRGVNHNRGSEPEDMVSLRLWSNGERVISARRRRLLSTEDVLEALRENDGPVDAAGLLVLWTDRIVAHMSDCIESFEEAVLDLEDGLLAGETGGLRLELAQVRKQTIALRRYLAPQREALARLFSEPLAWIGELDRLRLREIADRQLRHIETIDEVRERAAVAHDELAARLSEQLNARMYLLSLVAAVFLPLGFFTGLMGINVGGMPGVDSEGAFWVVAGSCALISAVLLTLFRLRRWL